MFVARCEEYAAQIEELNKDKHGKEILPQETLVTTFPDGNVNDCRGDGLRRYL